MTHIDAVWEQMQRESLQRDVGRVLRKSEASRSSHTQQAQQQLATQRAKKRSERHHTQLHTTAEDSDALSSTVAVSSTSLSTTHNALQQPFNLQRELNRLADERPSVRKQAALALEAHFLTNDTLPSYTSIGTVDDASGNINNMSLLPPFAEIAKPLFRRLNDPIEKVRAVCIRIATRYVAHEPDLLRVLPYLVPAVVNRIDCAFAYDEQQQQFTRDAALHDAFKRGRVFVDAPSTATARVRPNEPSEEVRVLFLELIGALLANAFARSATSILHAYMFDILVLLVNGVYDACPDANVLACALLRGVSDHMVSVMKHFSVACVRACQHLLVHRLARVRVAAIDAVRALVSCPNRDKCRGSGTDAIVDLLGHRDDNVIPVAAFYTHDVRINYFARLDQDVNANVRRAFFAMVCDWITHLPDRYDHESRLMPYVLSAVSDTNADIAHAALATLADLGATYEREHGADVLELKQYSADGRSASYNYSAPLPLPIGPARPALGTRLFVRGRARRFLAPVLRELAHWQRATRCHAVRLLTTIVVYCEETITVDAHALVQTFLREWRTSDIECELRVVAELVGRFVSPETYVPLLLARIRGDADASITPGVIAPAETAVALEVLQQLMAGSLDRTLLPHVHDVLDAVAARHILNFEHTPTKAALGRVVQHVAELLQRRGHDAVSAHYLQHGRLTTMQRVHEQLFDVALVVAHTAHSVDAVESATVTLDALARLESRATTAALVDAHFAASLTRAADALVAMSAVQWTPHCAAQLIVDELLSSARVEIVLAAAPTLTPLFQFALAPMSDENERESHSVDDRRDKRATATAATSSRATQRAAAYMAALHALLARVELELPSTEMHKLHAAAPAWHDAVTELQALALASRAAAA